MDKKITLEVAIASVQDARTACAAGADRVELSMALELDGLTPSAGLIAAVRAVCTVPIVLLIRPRPGDFIYTQTELDVMCRDAEAWPGEMALGCLTAEGAIDVTALRRFPTQRVVFHRAFDRVANPTAALETLIDLGIPRVMLHAAHPERIARLRDQARGRIDLLPAGGVRPDKVRALLQITGCDQVHGSFRRTSTRQDILFGAFAEVCPMMVHEMRLILDSFSR
ncbi:MAG: copper homeostasis protein CutC [Gemmataceae bacterium]